MGVRKNRVFINPEVEESYNLDLEMRGRDWEVVETKNNWCKLNIPSKNDFEYWFEKSFLEDTGELSLFDLVFIDPETEKKQGIKQKVVPRKILEFHSGPNGKVWIQVEVLDSPVRH